MNTRYWVHKRFPKCFLSIVFGAVEKEDRYAVFDPASRIYLSHFVADKDYAWSLAWRNIEAGGKR